MKIFSELPFNMLSRFLKLVSIRALLSTHKKIPFFLLFKLLFSFSYNI